MGRNSLRKIWFRGPERWLSEHWHTCRQNTVYKASKQIFKKIKKKIRFTVILGREKKFALRHEYAIFLINIHKL